MLFHLQTHVHPLMEIKTITEKRITVILYKKNYVFIYLKDLRFGPDGKGGCILGSGRFPSLNGTKANQGDYDSNFGNQMYPFFAK